MSVETIFAAAAQKPTADRAAYLAEACGDDAELRGKVERLLKAHDAAGDFLESPAHRPAGTIDFTPIAERVGTKIGPYILREQIGEGGFGLVFVAEQVEPVKRKVALKVIKPGMDSQQVIARFEAERQALALMDHPNIARVLDASATESGRPYFVMELVRGIPITDYCDQNQLPPRERLDLFVSVCQAIQHAHQKGIIHRDIKPSNVLVTSHDGKPIAKVIDFGVAKAIHQQLTERTIYTNFAQMVGTPLYMSPEQAEMSGLDIDTRSDIYSLGVLLYELLTGSTPLEKQRFREAAYDEIRRLIREEEPPKPSTRLSQSGESLPSVAAQRKTEPAKLSKLMRGDLDWITMKALEKDRTRRYETANGLARDIQRYLSDEPVEASPPSATYRLRKFARKNRAALTTAAAVVLVLASAAAVSAWQAKAARRAETAAVAALAEAEQARSDETAAKETAESRAAETEAVLNFVQQKIFAAARPEGQGGGLGRDVKLREAVESAVPFVESSFADRPLIEARLRRSIGQSFGYLGDYQAAEHQLRAAQALYTQRRGPDHPDTLRCTHDLAIIFAEAGRFRDAIRLFEETLAKRRAHGADDLDTFGNMVNLASEYHHMSRHADAILLYKQALATLKSKFPRHTYTFNCMEGLASSLGESGQPARALELREEVYRWRLEVFGPDQLETAQGRKNLAVSYADAGRLDEAVKLLKEAIAVQKEKLGPDHYMTLASMTDLARVYFLKDRGAESLELLDDIAARQTAKFGADSPYTLATLFGQSFIYESQGRHEDALRLRQQVLRGRRKSLGADHRDTVVTMELAAESLLKLGRAAEALPLLDQSIHDMRRNGIDPHLLVDALSKRLDHFAKAKDASGCRQSAEMFEEGIPKGADGLYNAACFRAVTAAVCQADAKMPADQKARLAQEEADRAMKWLKQAVAAGLTDVKQIKGDDDLTFLRGREDFKKLLAELENQPADRRSMATKG